MATRRRDGDSKQMTEIPRPDLTDRPHRMTCERLVRATPETVFDAWTQTFDTWFAEPGMLWLTSEPGAPFFFYNRLDWGRHPHYGRILDLRTDSFVEMTWVTGNGEPVGTEGAETILAIELTPDGADTHVRLTHSGFASEQARDAHAENWPLALDILNEAIAG